MVIGIVYCELKISSEKKNQTVKAWVSSHPTCKDLVVTYWNQTTGVCIQKILTHLHFGKEFIAYNF